MCCRAPPPVRVQLGECVRSITYIDFPDKWPGLLPLLVQNLATQVRLSQAVLLGNGWRAAPGSEAQSSMLAEEECPMVTLLIHIMSGLAMSSFLSL